MPQIENLFERIKLWIYDNRRALFWSGAAILTLWLLIETKEVLVLLLLSYVTALLIDPAVTALSRRKGGRGFWTVFLGLWAVVVIFIFILVLIPALLDEYELLVKSLPSYFENASHLITQMSQSFGITIPTSQRELMTRLQQKASSVGFEQVKAFAAGAGSAVLSGYSLTLTLLNLVLVPFFVYYISVELPRIHKFVLSYLSYDHAVFTARIGREIMGHVRIFFRGQITVSFIMAVLYVIGLWLVGLPSALLVGMVAGLLNIVPYLGIVSGIVLATFLTLVHEPSIGQLLLVWGVFIVVQVIEGNVLTPRIIGESMGIHPLGVMLALIVGGQLLGLVGLILALPAAASLRVLFQHLMAVVETDAVPT